MLAIYSTSEVKNKTTFLFFVCGRTEHQALGLLDCSKSKPPMIVSFHRLESDR